MYWQSPLPTSFSHYLLGVQMNLVCICAHHCSVVLCNFLNHFIICFFFKHTCILCMQHRLLSHVTSTLNSWGGNVSGAVMLAPTRPPSFSNTTPGGSSDLYYSPPPAPLPYSSPEMLHPVVSLSIFGRGEPVFWKWEQPASLAITRFTTHFFTLIWTVHRPLDYEHN